MNQTSKLLFIDFETASRISLKNHGMLRYALDESTIVKCLTWRFEDMDKAELWIPGEDFPCDVAVHMDKAGLFVAHNAAFDFLIWNHPLRRLRPDLPILKLAQVRCSAARARYNGLPGGLGAACESLQLSVGKDLSGRPNMLFLAEHPEYTPESHPEEHGRLYAYALTDTDAMVELWNRTLPLPVREQNFHALDLEINHRGFGVDVDGAKAIEELKSLFEAQINFEIAVLTEGKVLAATERDKLQNYLGADEDLDDVARGTLRQVLKKEELGGNIRAVIEARLDASRTPKKAAAILRAHVGGRICHSTIWHGALSGRSTAGDNSAGGLQSLNFASPRPGKTAEICESYLEAAKRKDINYLNLPEHRPPLAALADAQRALVCARPGHVLLQADLSGIESRMAAWLAGDEDKLSNYEKGVDAYKVAASGIFEKSIADITKAERQIGKIAELSLTFGGGEDAYIGMAAANGLEVSRDEATGIVSSWRSKRPAFERWWAMADYSALIALDQPGRKVSMPVGRGDCSCIEFMNDGTALRMKMPSGRVISYHAARLHLDPSATAPIAVYNKPAGYVEKLDRQIKSNNQTQGLARCLFWELMSDVNKVLPVVHSVYDELLIEVPEKQATSGLLDHLIERMCTPPSWVPGLPLGAEGHISFRWRKG